MTTTPTNNAEFLQVVFAGLTKPHHTVRADDGRVTFTVSRWNQSRAFTDWNDVLAFLTVVGGAE